MRPYTDDDGSEGPLANIELGETLEVSPMSAFAADKPEKYISRGSQLDPGAHLGPQRSNTGPHHLRILHGIDAAPDWKSMPSNTVGPWLTASPRRPPLRVTSPRASADSWLSRSTIALGKKLRTVRMTLSRMDRLGSAWATGN